MVVGANVALLKRGYKHTDVGTIPEDWDVKELEELGDCIIGLTYHPSNVKRDGLLVLRSSNIDENELVFTDNVFVDMTIPEKLIARKGDILICVRNGSRNLIGKCALIDERAAGMTFGAFMSIFRTKCSGYVFYMLQSDIVKRQINANIGATINQITNKDLRAFKIPIPRSEREQDVITDTLGDIDRLLVCQGRLIAKKRDIRQAMMQQLLTGESRLAGFSGEWKVKRLGDIVQFLGSANSPRSELSDSGPIKYIHYGDIHTKWRSFLDCSLDDLPRIQQAPAGSVPFLEDGDLVMADASEDTEAIGISVEVKNATRQHVVSGLHTLVLRAPKSELADGFKGYLQYIPAVKDALKRVATGISVFGLSKTNVGNISISLPEILEQRAIAGILSEMDDEIRLLEQRLEKTRQVKQGMMQELLTGGRRLV